MDNIIELIRFCYVLILQFSAVEICDMVEEAKRLVEKLIKSTHTLAELAVAFQFKEQLSAYPEELRDAYGLYFSQYICHANCL